jgi:restriction system protein
MAQRRVSRRRRSADQQRLLLVLIFGALALYLAFSMVISLAQTLAAAHWNHSPLALVMALLASVGAATAGVVLWRRIHRAARRWRQADRLAQAQTLEGLRSLTPTQFELAIGDLMWRQGFREVRHTGGGGDLAADLICRDGRGARVIVQCKRYGASHAVTSPEMQQFIGMIYAHHHADYGIYVTSSTFTQPASALARQHGIRLLDGASLAALAGRLQPPRRASMSLPPLFQQTFS